MNELHGVQLSENNLGNEKGETEEGENGRGREESEERREPKKKWDSPR